MLIITGALVFFGAFIVIFCVMDISGGTVKVLAGLCAAAIVSIAVNGALASICTGPRATAQTRAEVMSTYERLVSNVNSEEKVCSSLAKEVNNYNEMVKTGKDRQNDFRYFGMVPKIYDEFELIVLPNTEDSKQIQVS